MLPLSLLLVSLTSLVRAQASGLLPCGDAFYYPSKYTCYNGNFLCPILHSQATLQCGNACYLPDQYSCKDGELIYPPTRSTPPASTSGTSPPTSSSSTPLQSCTSSPTTQHLPDAPYDNYFYSDCHSATQVIITTPQSDSNLTLIGPRLLVAWPAGNSGVVAFFAPSNGENGTLSINIVNASSSGDSPLMPVYISPNSSSLTGNPRVGTTAMINLNSSAILTIPILGSIRTIRDFTEGPSILVPQIQDAISYKPYGNGGVNLNRLWLDNMTSTDLSFVPVNGSPDITIENTTVHFKAGTYRFNATFDYEQLKQLTTKEVLRPSAQTLIQGEPGRATSLQFLSYSNKLLAGAWRFLTYFGRDSMISTLLMQPILSEGEGGAVEAVIGAVLERINKTDGSVCHEETIGDYATYENEMDNTTSTKPTCSYIMIDSDYYLPVVMRNYFVNSKTGQQRLKPFFAQNSTLNFGNIGLNYMTLAQTNAERVMSHAQAFAQPGGQTMANLRHIESDQIVGEWRDSTYGIGGGTIPFDVNTGLVPAALRAISDLANAGFYPSHPSWKTSAGQWAKVWEDHTLDFFAVNVSVSQAQNLLKNYKKQSGFAGPSQSDLITEPLTFHGLSLDGNDNQSTVKVMNTDVAFRLFLLNTTDDAQLTPLMNQTAQQIMLPFPAGLSTDVGMLVANPAYGGDPVYAANWTRSAYHGTVVWGWPMAMMGKGLEYQLRRCSATSAPTFCNDASVYNNVLLAYNHLWDLIDANKQHLSQKERSWTYTGAKFQFTSAGDLSSTESDIRQLWSLSFLAVNRNQEFKAPTHRRWKKS